MSRKVIVLFTVAVVTLVGCGGGSNKASAHDADVQRAVEDKIKQTINSNAIAQGFLTVKYLTAQCIPESDTRLSCIVTGSVGDQPLSATWEGIIDPDTGRFNVHSTG
jgi:hypothetical protein